MSTGNRVGVDLTHITISSFSLVFILSKLRLHGHESLQRASGKIHGFITVGQYYQPDRAAAKHQIKPTVSGVTITLP